MSFGDKLRKLAKDFDEVRAGWFVELDRLYSRADEVEQAARKEREDNAAVREFLVDQGVRLIDGEPLVEGVRWLVATKGKGDPT